MLTLLVVGMEVAVILGKFIRAATRVVLGLVIIGVLQVVVGLVVAVDVA